MKFGKWLWLGAVSAMTVAAPLGAQNVEFDGQVRPRYEYRDPAGSGSRDNFTSMRVRAAIRAMLEENVEVFIQLQDVRLFGEETNTLKDFQADNFDLHQGYVRYRGKRLDWLTTTVGRQEVNFGGQRLVGAVGWTQQGRSFDGVRFDVATGRTSVGLVGFQTAEATAPKISDSAELVGAYATVRDVGPGALDLYWLYDRVRGEADTDQHTYGGRFAWNGTVSGRLEATAQTGTRKGQDLSAYMVGARVGTKMAGGRVGVTLWYDYLSGDDDLGDGTTKVFSTLYATNHKYYGFADLFLDIPKHTGGYGLQDLALKTAFKINDASTLKADFHSFRAAQSNALPDSRFADEVDLTLVRRYTSNLSLTSGLSFVFQREAFAAIGRLSEDMTWAYVMLTATF
ncbi:MAG: alginate export family protein [Gemmatimonadota bacterium]